MKQIKLLIFGLALLLFSACGRNDPGQYRPEELMERIRQEVTLPEMVDVAGEMLEDTTGISPDDCESAVFYILEEGLAPDEIIIVRAKDAPSAERILEKLETRLAYKEKSAQQYLTEYLPVIQNGIVRKDGLTVSLIVSVQAARIEEVYNR